MVVALTRCHAGRGIPDGEAVLLPGEPQAQYGEHLAGKVAL